MRRLNIIKAGSYTRLPATRRPPTLKNTTDIPLIAIVLFLVLVPQSASAGTEWELELAAGYADAARQKRAALTDWQRALLGAQLERLREEPAWRGLLGG